MPRRRQIFEGRAKILFEGPEPGTLVQYFKDDVIVGPADAAGVVTGKGVLNNRISEYLLTRISEIGIPNYFVRRVNMREQVVRDVEMIPLEVIVRNCATGRFAERLNMEEGTPLPRSIVEFFYKLDGREPPLVTEEHITAFGWASPQDIDEMLALSLRINDFLSGVFTGIGMKLLDLKLEFGRLWEDDHARVVLADEICPESCSVVDTQTDQRLNREGRARDFSEVAEYYQKVARRIGLLNDVALEPGADTGAKTIIGIAP